MTMHLCCKDSNFVQHKTQERQALSHLFLELFWVCQLCLDVFFLKKPGHYHSIQPSFEVNSFPVYLLELDFLFFQDKMLFLFS